MFVCLCVHTRVHAYVRACACVTPEIHVVRVHNIREEGDTTTSFIKHTV